ncbi:hypothetical protein BKA70DRAFT_1229988 [Coprinopsis sp. MPI-PUGE-AT-0042]|nr:hypothetical protein BKA70DRAFT_1229988 [Coprinopsis sp. MPI-PUGE-AT-0042]
MYTASSGVSKASLSEASMKNRIWHALNFARAQTKAEYSQQRRASVVMIADITHGSRVRRIPNGGELAIALIEVYFAASKDSEQKPQADSTPPIELGCNEYANWRIGFRASIFVQPESWCTTPQKVGNYILDFSLLNRNKRACVNSCDLSWEGRVRLGKGNVQPRAVHAPSLPSRKSLPSGTALWTRGLYSQQGRLWTACIRRWKPGMASPRVSHISPRDPVHKHVNRTIVKAGRQVYGDTLVGLRMLSKSQTVLVSLLSPCVLVKEGRNSLMASIMSKMTLGFLNTVHSQTLSNTAATVIVGDAEGRSSSWLPLELDARIKLVPCEDRTVIVPATLVEKSGHGG